MKLNELQTNDKMREPTDGELATAVSRAQKRGVQFGSAKVEEETGDIHVAGSDMAGRYVHFVIQKNA